MSSTARSDVVSTERKSGGDGAGTGAVQGILDLNCLEYDTMPDLSVVVQRNFKNTFATKNTYRPGEVLSFILNTGAEYVNPRTSYLTFALDFPDTPNPAEEKTNAPHWGYGDSAYNVIRSIRITDRAGNEIEYIDDVNTLIAMLHIGQKSKDWHETEFTLSKQSPLDSTKPIAIGDQPSRGINTDTRPRYVLPLKFLCGLFSHDQLLPAPLMSGLRVEMRLETGARAFNWEKVVAETYNSSTDNYRLSDPMIVCDSYKLTDSVSRHLNQRAASEGLEIQFRTWFENTYTTASAKLNIESKKAVSRAFGALFWSQVAPGTEGQPVPSTETLDTCMSMDPWAITKYQWRAGSLYFPQQPVQTSSAFANQTAREAMHHTLNFFKKLETANNQAASLNISNYIRPIDANQPTRSDVTQDDTAYGNNYPLLAVSLERSNVQDVSGIPLNNSRVLAFNATFESDAERYCRLYLSYLKIARVFMDNTEVEE